MIDGVPVTLAEYSVVHQAIWGEVHIGGARAPVPDTVGAVITVAPLGTESATFGVAEYVHAFPDSRWEPAPLEVIEAASSLLAGLGRQGGDVLVRCQQGINRSRLVVAVAEILSGRTDREQLITELRAGGRGLTNPYFCDLIRSWPADPMARDDGRRR